MHDLTQLNLYKPTATLLQNKNILVTGASDGIGKAAALSFAQHGATVILLGRSEKKLSAVYDHIVNMGAPEPVIAPFDLTTAHESPYMQLGEHVSTSLGHLDGLLHNAGQLGELKPLIQYSGEMFAELLNVNLLSNFLLTKAMLPSMLKAKHASIVFTSSSVGRKGRAYWGGYSISKFGVEGLMQTWAEELAATSNVRCNSLNPCATNTTMRRQAYPAEARNSNPEAKEIMGAYLFLMGDESLSINGQQLDARNR